MNSKEKKYIEEKYYWASYKIKIMEQIVESKKRKGEEWEDLLDYNLSGYGDSQIKNLQDALIIQEFVDRFIEKTDPNNIFNWLKIRIKAKKDAIEKYQQYSIKTKI